MITCPKCSKDNQDHYKFCLGCGAELPHDAAPRPFSPRTPPHGLRAAQPGTSALAGTVASPPGAQAGGRAPSTAAQAAARPTTARIETPMPAGAYTAPPVASPTGPTSPAPGGAAPAAPPPPVQSPAAPPIAVQAPSPPAPAAPPPGTHPSSPPAEAAQGAPAAAPGTVPCPQCNHINQVSNVFCGACGFRLAASAERLFAQGSGAPVQAAPGAITLTALRADGSEAGTYALPVGGGPVGRETGGIFAGDSYLSPVHASFRPSGPARATVKDEKSLNGVYRKLGRDVPTELKPGDIFRIGQEIIRYEALTSLPPSPDGVARLGAPSKGYVGRIALVIGREETGNAFPIPESGIQLGRERGDVLFPEDGYVSGLHCRLTWDGSRLFLTDLGSSNGTFLRITDGEFRSGDVLLMGQQLFRIAV